MNRARADRRRAGVLLTALLVLLGGWGFGALQPDAEVAATTSAAKAAPPAAGDLQQRFDESVMLLHARRYEQAIPALQRVLALAPRLPEAHANLGFALLGQQRPREARASFEHAMALRPDLANAYYGLALANEAEGDLPLAIGAMRSYLHLARQERPEHLRRARAALWEWENATSGR